MRAVITSLEDVLVQAQQIPDVAVLVLLVRSDSNRNEQIDRVHAFVHAPAGTRQVLLESTQALIDREANPLTRMADP